MYGAPRVAGAGPKAGSPGCVGCAGNPRMHEWRRTWRCPDEDVSDLPPKRLVIPGCREEFPDCPVYYLRTQRDKMPAVHLVDGIEHPDVLVAEKQFEIESGALSIADVPVKVLELVHLRRSQQADRDRYEIDQAARERKMGGR